MNLRKLIRNNPILYNIRVIQLRGIRRLQNCHPRVRFARLRNDDALAYPVKRHQSLLRRKLGDTDPQLQENKIVNLQLSTAKIDGLLIRPGETFSFWQAIGRTTARKGYVEGLLLSHGEVGTGVGGGLCQLANLLFWMAMHSPLDVVERHHHSFDAFPDERRVLPFGSGASVFYNYIDLRFVNRTDATFQLHTWLTDEHLKGAILCDEDLPLAYHLEERNHRFSQADGTYYRSNEIWRKTVDKRTGNTVNEERLIQNHAEVKYPITLSDL